mmetsp:Transcript_30049/g.44367  ORF Transcript_30049/g.44367 Transcript_30049/m.44367 type:complete len:97 (+) Transcript_30049:885-1175(+)
MATILLHVRLVQRMTASLVMDCYNALERVLFLNMEHHWDEIEIITETSSSLLQGNVLSILRQDRKIHLSQLHTLDSHTCRRAFLRGIDLYMDQWDG